jgi:phosphoribosylaminoimidazole carboxylase PurE protein
MIGPWIDIIIGSKKSDGPFTEGATEVLKACDVGYSVSAISAHRHKKRHAEHCKSAIIAGAGWNAALPGDTAAEINYSKQVFGVALPDFPGGIDAGVAISRMPGGCPVGFTGWGKDGFKNAAIMACQGICNGDNIVCAAIQERLAAYIAEQAGEPEENYETSEERSEKKEEG